MKIRNLKRFHRYFGIIAMMLILSFLLSTVWAEITQDPIFIFQVKRYILVAIPLLLVLLPGTALSGKRMSGHSDNLIIRRKEKRMKFIAANGFLLIILAILLYIKAYSYDFDTLFWILQISEVVLGTTNLILLSLMARDGMRLTRGAKSISSPG